MEILKYLQVIVSILLALVILVQTPTTSLSLSSMSSESAWKNKKRGPAKFLHISTIVLAVIFILNSTVLFILG